MTGPSRRKPRPTRIRVRWRLLLFVLLLLAGLGVWLFWAVNTNPGWYHPPDRTNERVVELGHQTQNRVITQVHKVRRIDPAWRIELTADEMNAWLAVNLPGWLEHETGRTWPDAVSTPIVSIEEEGLNIGVQIPRRFGDRVLAVRMRPHFIDYDEELVESGVDGGAPEDDLDASGHDEPDQTSELAPESPPAGHSTPDNSGERRVVLDINRVSIGNLSVPGPIARRITAAIQETLAGDVPDGDFEQIVRILLGEQSIRPVIRLSDERLVRIVDVEFEDDIMTLTCLTQTGKPPMELEKEEHR